jgi:hypothetical protein
MPPRSGGRFDRERLFAALEADGQADLIARLESQVRNARIWTATVKLLPKTPARATAGAGAAQADPAISNGKRPNSSAISSSARMPSDGYAIIA